MGVTDDFRAQARGDIHEHASVPAAYLPAGTAVGMTAVSVRRRTKFGALGQMAGGFDAERAEVTPKLIFLHAEVPSPSRGAVVVISGVEVYRVSAAEPRDGITVSASVTRVVAPGEISALPWAAINALMGW